MTTISLFCYYEKVFFLMNIWRIGKIQKAHSKRVSKDFEIKNVGEYYELYVQSDTLLLVDVFGNFRNICVPIYKPDTANIFQVLD